MAERFVFLVEEKDNVLFADTCRRVSLSTFCYESVKSEPLWQTSTAKNWPNNTVPF